MLDAHDAASRHPAGEGDDTGPDHPNDVTGLRGVVEPSVPRTVGVGGRTERIGHGTVDRRSIAWSPGRSPAVHPSISGTTASAGAGIADRTCRRADEGPMDDQQPRQQPCDHPHSRRGRPGGRPMDDQTASSDTRDRRWSSDLVWIWHTRDSVTPSTRPISCSVMFS